jgi:hypothetical protein
VGTRTTLATIGLFLCYQLSKIIEKLLNKRLLSYLDKFNILSPAQFGFRRGKSTEDAVCELSSLVTEQLDKRGNCLSVFLDLRKAFDSVSHQILVQKLEKIGIRGTSLSLFKDYLTNRKQKVKLDNYTSLGVGVSYGVPQGSVLGPTLFLVYINDLCSLQIKNAKIITYADDTAIVFTGNSWEAVKINAEIGLVQVDKWLQNNILSLNTDKTNYMCFSIYNDTQPSKDYTIKIHRCDNTDRKQCSCPTITKASQIKYLGIILDQRLSWYAHLEHVITRIRKLTWIFKTLRHLLPRDVTGTQTSKNNLLRDIYVALAQSIMTYCIPIWGGAAKTRFLEIERTQRNLIKLMYFKKTGFATNSLYDMCKLLSIRKLYITCTILRKHKYIPYDPTIISKRRKDLVTVVPRTNTTFASRQYNRRSAYLYNKINKMLNIYDK